MKLSSFSCLAALACVLCAGCSSVTEGTIQPLTIRTPGANNAECSVSTGTIKYTYNPPMTRNITKSNETMMVDCLAPGNRHKVVYVKPIIASSTFLNLGNGLAPGVAVDYASKAMYNYPDVVDVDFTYTKTLPFPLPAQNLEDIRQPEDYDLEEFSPGLPRLNSDRYVTVPEIRRREVPSDFDLQGFAGQEGDPVAAPVPHDFSADGSDSGANTGSAPASTVRVIGTINEGVSVPVPPAPGQNTNPSGASMNAGNKTSAPVQPHASDTAKEESSSKSSESAADETSPVAPVTPGSGHLPALVPSKNP